MQQPKTPKHINTTKQYVIVVKQWLIQHRVAVLIVLGALIITGVFCGALWRLSSSPSLESSSFTAKPKKVEKFHSPLTGLEVADEAATKQPTTGVMIENSPDARPQSGLKKAGIVYEAVAEGGHHALYGDIPARQTRAHRSRAQFTLVLSPLGSTLPSRHRARWW